MAQDLSPVAEVATLQPDASVARTDSEKRLLDALNNIRTLMLKRSTPSLRTYICDEKLRKAVVSEAERQLQRCNVPLTRI